MFETDRTEYSEIYHKPIKGTELYTKAAVLFCYMFTSLLPPTLHPGATDIFHAAHLKNIPSYELE